MITLLAGLTNSARIVTHGGYFFFFVWFGIHKLACRVQPNRTQVNTLPNCNEQFQFQFQFCTVNLKNSDKTKSRGVVSDRANLD